jgi:hypothetical protein
VIDWERFRPLLDERLAYGDQSKGGRIPWCPALMLAVFELFNDQRRGSKFTAIALAVQSLGTHDARGKRIFPKPLQFLRKPRATLHTDQIRAKEV